VCRPRPTSHSEADSGMIALLNYLAIFCACGVSITIVYALRNEF
jgi:hypothetical protein